MKWFCSALLAGLIGLFSGAGPAPVSPPNVLLLSVDTLRADRLGCYGNALQFTPNLDRLASGGLLVRDAVCEIPLTGPSFGSMLSSRYPRSTGVTRNGLPMPEDVPLITERFEEAGYATFCVQSNWTLKDKLSGLSRGFEHYDDAFHQKRWGFIKPERGGEEVTERALALLAEQRPDRPFFGWIHYSDPHAPYKLHKDFNPHGKKAWRLKQTEKVRVKYDSEVAYTDHLIGRLLAALPENTVVVFVGDHGESLFEHEYLGHGRRIHQTGMHIPIILQGPGITPGVTDAPVSGVDVGPTLLAAAGLEPLPGMMGFSVLSGDIPADRPRVIETYGGAVPNLPGAKALMADAAPMRRGVLRNGWKLILDGKHEELFYLPEDPGELHDRHTAEPGETQALREIVEAWDIAVPRVQAGNGAALTDEDVEALKSLGYVD